MGSPKLILHMGTPKTGTTSQQLSLARDREALSGMGLYYPDSRPFLSGPPEAHHRVAHHLARDGDISPELEQFRDEVLARAGDHDMTIISAEAMWRHGLAWTEPRRDLDDPSYRAARARYLERLAEFFAGFSVTPLLYFRDLGSFAHSCFKEGQLKRAAYRSFEDYNDTGCARFAYDAQLAMIETAFGHVESRLFASAVRDGVYSDLLRVAGVAHPPGGVSLHERRSPPNRALQWITRRCGGTAVTPEEMTRLRAFVGSKTGRALFDGQRVSLWDSRESWLAFAARYRSERLPSTNVDPEDEPHIAPWTKADHRRAERRFLRWRVMKRLRRSGDE